MRGLILSTFLALALLSPGWAETSSTPEPDWPELWSYLDEIGSAFQSVTESSQPESERLEQERKELEQEKAASALERAELQSERQSLSEERKRLDAEKQDSKELERLYADIGKDLDKANKRLKRARIGGIIAVVAAAAAGALIGYEIGN